MRGNELSVGDFRALFVGLSDDVIPDIRVEDGDRFGSPTTSVTVLAGNSLTGNEISTRDLSDPFGPREATR
jgi:hypothetical protein